MSNLAKTFTVVALAFFSLHLLSGWSYCQSNFCPGDSESDYVYEYEGDNGEKYVVIDNSPITKDDYNKIKEPN